MENYTVADIFLLNENDSSSFIEDEFGTTKTTPYVKNLLSLALLGVIACNGVYDTNPSRRHDITPTVKKIAVADATTSFYPLDVPSPKATIGLFADLENDTELDSYYKRAKIFDISDFS